MNLTKAALTAVLISASASGFAAGDAAAGKTKATQCAACHGASGISAADIWPNLAGQKAGYLVKQMKAFKDGTRQDASMAAMIAPLTEQDMEDLAAYYSSLK